MYTKVSAWILVLMVPMLYLTIVVKTAITLALPAIMLLDVFHVAKDSNLVTAVSACRFAALIST